MAITINELWRKGSHKTPPRNTVVYFPFDGETNPRSLQLPGMVTLLDCSRQINNRKKLDRISFKLATQIDGTRIRSRKMLSNDDTCLVYYTTSHPSSNIIVTFTEAIISSLWTLSQQATLFVAVIIAPPQFIFQPSFCILHAACCPTFQTDFGCILFAILRNTDSPRTERPVWLSNFLHC
jgi:hypothetical protein